MRCEDLTRAPALPEGTRRAAERAEHLASCPRCAEWSRGAARLDRIWEATRPPEPSGRDLDVLWARASAALDAPRPSTIPFEAPARRARWSMVALFAAQAAAVLVAAASLLRDGPSTARAPIAVTVAPPSRIPVEVDTTLIVRIDAAGHRVEVLDDSGQFALSSMADATPHDVFNSVESMASQ